jgi:hypothetical protein
LESSRSIETTWQETTWLGTTWWCCDNLLHQAGVLQQHFLTFRYADDPLHQTGVLQQHGEDQDGSYLAVLLMILSTRLESSSSMEKTWLADATTGGGSELEKRYGLKYGYK